MAVLNAYQLAEIRRDLADEVKSVPWRKPPINAAIQAIEDILTGAALQTAISNAINSATTPLVLDATQKRLLVRHVLYSRFERGNN